MESVLARYRNLIVLAVVLFVQILGLAVQVRRSGDPESGRLIRVWAVTAVTPFEKVLVWTQTSISDVWHNYFYLRGVRAENRELKQEIERMHIEQVRMSQDADQARRLQALLAFKEQFISQTLAAQVIGSSGSEQSRSFYIDKGESDGVKPDMAVITADGVVGKVLRVYRSTSLVLLINDPTSGVGAILEKSRLQGILRGTASGEVVLEKVMSDEAVPPGERVLTSGGDRIFPKGIPIGAVTQVAPGSDLFLNIRVKPSAHLSKLEEVLVVTRIDERQATPELTGPLRAADILAERLPSVPVKPADADNAPAASSGSAPNSAKPSQSGSVPPAVTKPAANATMTGSTAPPALKPKPAAPAAANNLTGARPRANPPATEPATPAGAAKITEKPAKPQIEPEPQPVQPPPTQDNPQ